MGRLTVDRWLDEQAARGFTVKNTFLDVPVLADGSAPPLPVPLARCRTAPSGLRDCSADDAFCCYESASTSGSARGEEDVAVSPTLSVSTAPPPPPAEHLPEIAIDGYCDEWRVAVRRTFLEWTGPTTPTIRRSASMPEIPPAVDAKGVGEAWSEEAPPADAIVEPEVWPETPRGEDEPCEAMCFFMPMPACEFYGDCSVYDGYNVNLLSEGYAMAPCSETYAVAPFNEGFCAGAACGQGYAVAEEDLSWPKEYDQALAAEEFSAGALVPSGGRGRRARRTAERGTEVDVLQIIADANAAACSGCDGQVWALATRDGASSLAVQRAIAVLARVLRDPVAGRRWRVQFDVEAVLSQFRGRILEAVQHPHANHVIKQVLDVMPSEYAAFVAEELRGSAVWASKHKFGCRAVLRLVQHRGLESAEAVVAEALHSADELCRDDFGKFVIEEILERGAPEQRSLAMAALRERLPQNARHEHASFLIQRALRGSGGGGIAEELLSHQETVHSLARNQFGRYVLRDVARSKAYTGRIRDALAPLNMELLASKQGKKFLMDLAADI